jgi:cytochrome c-type biogenesis protein CcmH/NrfF
MNLFMGLVGVLFWTTILFSQDTLEQQMRIKALVNDLRCPTCQGLSVKDSEAGFSVSIRKKAEGMVREGFSDQEIRDYFVERYGEWILRAPPMEGFNLLLWALPGAAILFGMLLVFTKSRRWVESETYHDNVKTLSEDEEELVRKDLENFRQD